MNGSFEEPRITEAAGFAILDSIPGWVVGNAGVELQADGVGRWTASGIARGEQFAELDTTENSYLFQDAPTEQGQAYWLNLAYAPRNLDSPPADSNDVELSWEGSRVALLGGASIPGEFRQEAWRLYTYRVVANSGTGFSRLQFEALGTSNGKGGLIDRVSLVPIPEPRTLCLSWAAVALVVTACRRSR